MEIERGSTNVQRRAEMPVWDLLHEFGKMKVSFTNISVEDLKELEDSIEVSDMSPLIILYETSLLCFLRNFMVK